MASIFGFSGNKFVREERKKTLLRMQNLVSHQDSYRSDPVFIDNEVTASRVNTNIIQNHPQPFCKNNIYIWFTGEFYNQDDLCEKDNSKRISDPKILYQLFTRHNTFDFLKDIDGIFSAIIYDQREKKIHLVTDRYGFKHLYWTIYNGELYWFSEVKCMLALSNYSPKICQQALSNFFTKKHFMENESWFQDVSLLSPATVLTWDILTKTVNTEVYWNWNEIKQLPTGLDEFEIIEELGRLFINAIKMQTLSGEKIGLNLSGGLDSRAILAAMPDNIDPLHTFTIGTPKCDDVRIARIASLKKNAVHHFHEITSNNWFDLRAEGVWWSDGGLNIMHMHCLQGIKEQTKIMKINMNGFLGDAVLGGSYIEKPGGVINTIFNRGRRFVLLGNILFDIFGHTRLPFFNNALIEFCLSIPENLRLNSYIYNKMLIHMFPEYFMKIPWQKTGIPISQRDHVTNISKFLWLSRNYVYRNISRFGIPVLSPLTYVDYDTWIRDDPAKKMIGKILFGKNAIYPDYINKRDVQNEFNRHMRGENLGEILCGRLTFEIWLKQIHKEKICIA